MPCSWDMLRWTRVKRLPSARIKEDGVLPNERTYVAALNSRLAGSENGNEGAERIHVKKRCLQQVRAIHSHATESGSELALFFRTMLVDAVLMWSSVKKRSLQLVRGIHSDVVQSGLDSALFVGTSRKWSNVEIGRQAFDCAVKFDKYDAAPYVLMSNIYRAAHMWEDASTIEAMRAETGVDDRHRRRRASL